MTQLRTESRKQSSQVASQEKKPKWYQWKAPPMHTLQVGVPVAETIYQKVQYIKKQKRKKKRQKSGKKANRKFTFGRDISSFYSTLKSSPYCIPPFCLWTAVKGRPSTPWAELRLAKAHIHESSQSQSCSVLLCTEEKALSPSFEVIIQNCLKQLGMEPESTGPKPSTASDMKVIPALRVPTVHRNPRHIQRTQPNAASPAPLQSPAVPHLPLPPAPAQPLLPHGSEGGRGEQPPPEAPMPQRWPHHWAAIGTAELLARRERKAGVGCPLCTACRDHDLISGGENPSDAVLSGAKLSICTTFDCNCLREFWWCHTGRMLKIAQVFLLCGRFHRLWLC